MMEGLCFSKHRVTKGFKFHAQPQTGAYSCLALCLIDELGLFQIKSVRIKSGKVCHILVNFVKYFWILPNIPELNKLSIICL